MILRGKAMRLAAACLVLALCAALAGCGEKDPGDRATPDPPGSMGDYPHGDGAPDKEAEDGFALEIEKKAAAAGIGAEGIQYSGGAGATQAEWASSGEGWSAGFSSVQGGTDAADRSFEDRSAEARGAEGAVSYMGEPDDDMGLYIAATDGGTDLYVLARDPDTKDCFFLTLHVDGGPGDAMPEEAVRQLQGFLKLAGLDGEYPELMELGEAGG